jgi:CheY-like chemotaxis protein
MKKRRILIIHDSKVFRNILKRTLTAEVPDVDLHVAISAREGIERLSQESFDMVISANEMEYMNGTGIHELMREGNSRHQKTGFLLLSSITDSHSLKKFEEMGIANVLKYPFEAGELAYQVEKLSHGSQWRRHKRIAVPGAQAVIDPKKAKIPLAVVNLSLGGMLANLHVADGIPKFSRYYSVKVLFPEEYGSVEVNTKGYILREDALQWLEPPNPEILQVAWRLTPVSDKDKSTLSDVLDKAVKLMGKD